MKFRMLEKRFIQTLVTRDIVRGSELGSRGELFKSGGSRSVNQ